MKSHLHHTGTFILLVCLFVCGSLVSAELSAAIGESGVVWENTGSSFPVSRECSIGPENITIHTVPLPDLSSATLNKLVTPSPSPGDTNSVPYAPGGTGSSGPAGAIPLPGSTARPDLVVTEVTAPASVSPGNRMTVSATVKNNGITYASFSSTIFSLSEDQVPDSGDTVLGKISTSPLPAGSSRTVSTTVTIPSGTRPGTYYLFAVADGAGRIAEEDEQNNGGFRNLGVQPAPPSTQPVTPVPTLTLVPATPLPGGTAQPDLVVTSVTAPPTGRTGTKISLSVAVKNAGDSSASSFVTAFYLSSDPVVDPGDTYLGRASVLSLSPGSVKTVSATPVIPSGIPEGTYHICVLADSTDRVRETDEDNNGAASAGVIIQSGLLPDLVVVSVSGPVNGYPGGNIPLTARVQNQGRSGSESTVVSFYLSRDTVVTADDLFLGSGTVKGLPAGVSQDIFGNGIIPASTQSGTYHLGAVVDSALTVRESDEGNNGGWSTETLVVASSSAGTVEARVETAIIEYTNRERIAAGLPPLVHNPHLSSIARSHSLDMKVRDFFSHKNPDGLDPFERMNEDGYFFFCAGENIAANSRFTPADDPDEIARYFVQEQWMKSSGHRANILGSCCTEIGVGVVYEPDRSSSPFGFIASQEFGKPR